MSSTSESGHPKNVANMATLITTVTEFGVKYNPSKSFLKIPALQALQKKGQDEIDKVAEANRTLAKKQEARVLAFSPVSPVVTKVMNALRSSNVPEATMEDALFLQHKLQGKRESPKLTATQKKELTDAGKPAKENSTSQMSYDLRLDNFKKFIILVKSVDDYTPNEEDLKIIALDEVCASMKTTNTAVIAAQSTKDNACIERDKVLYTHDTGLVDIAQDAKTYTKSVFGASSREYKLISKIKFTHKKDE